jgi:hypothetical protein
MTPLSSLSPCGGGWIEPRSGSRRVSGMHQLPTNSRILSRLKFDLIKYKLGASMETARYLQAAGSITTALLAIVIFIQVRKIRQIEWLSKANESWNQFNNFLVTSSSAPLFESFVAGERAPAHDISKVRTIVFSYLNIIYSVATARKYGLVLPEFADAMLNTHYGILRNQKDFVRPLLVGRGYAKFFEDEIFP